MRVKCLHTFLVHLENEAGDGEACDVRDLSALKGTPCEQCYNAYEAERAGIVRIAERMKKYRRGLKPAAGEIYMSQLPDDIVVSGIVEPLSHEARFRMLKSLSVKSMTYTELSGITGLDGGHLLYHLNKLVASGLVDKADGKYAISDKGMGIMELIKKLYSA
jgi:DNA-binding transcriptional ArsR family regulator